MYPSIHPTQVLRLIFKTYSAVMNNEWREDEIEVERCRHLEKRDRENQFPTPLTGFNLCKIYFGTKDD